jgi:hypothetical protein
VCSPRCARRKGLLDGDLRWIPAPTAHTHRNMRLYSHLLRSRRKARKLFLRRAPPPRALSCLPPTCPCRRGGASLPRRVSLCNPPISLVCVSALGSFHPCCPSDSSDSPAGPPPSPPACSRARGACRSASVLACSLCVGVCVCARARARVHVRVFVCVCWRASPSRHLS